MTRLRYADAALRYAAAANTVPTSRQDARLGYLVQEAEALYQQGDERGDNTAAQQALTITTQILQQQSRDDAPLQWAGAERNRGLVLTMLGARESGTEHLEEAVAAHRAALEEQTRERVPLDWAGTENNLGDVLWLLGDRGSGTAHLQEAVAAFRAALGGTDARSDAVRLGKYAEQPRQRALDTGQARKRHSASGGGGHSLPRGSVGGAAGTRAASDATLGDRQSVVVHGDGSRVN